jgi:hypothetical protein
MDEEGRQMDSADWDCTPVKFYNSPNNNSEPNSIVSEALEGV